MIQNIKKNTGRWKLIEHKKPAILALEDLQYIDDKRKKLITKGGGKANV